ncbi:glycoside hydrolase family 13 protein [Flavisolibacter tropicus]|uniref:Alpha-amylase n=1 Tax=Flavisolibacter tropicus TaxID=1492898 RepID=A0A172TRY9_9BACT|nr:glycoside hydrolase family 13 protein [Flavisolibacter tropicus]ANE49533.1 alpha-amylase [Flavisolibacter tropicus]
MKRLTLFFLALLAIKAYSQSIKVYPTNWWVDMKHNKIQLIIHQEDSTQVFPAKLTVRSSSPDFKIVKVHQPENPRYLFIDAEISATAKPQKVKLSLGGTTASAANTINYELKPRRSGKGTSYAQGVTSVDFMYLIMPDRFANGDPANDKIAGMKDHAFSRDSIYYRHGGDLQGVINHLDYLQELGVTAIWLNPVLENNMPRTSYHGYAFTDHYTIDPRFGGDTAYKRLINEMHKRGLKMVQDAVYNHVGTEHWFVKDQPTKDWLHQWPTYTNTTYKDQVLFDPYASKSDHKKMSDGWFVPSMPDLNQQNPYVANFLIQHALWTVEEFGIDGWRIDTYAYNDLEFMNRCNKALLDEYPKLTIFGETWVHGVPNQSYFVNNNYKIAYKSNQPGVTDFQALWGLQDAMTKDFGWTDGVNRLYTTLAQDFVYKDPMQNVIFMDNHDLSRFYSVVGEDLDKYKMSIGWLLTSRGVPQWYYGAEIGMKGLANPDGWVRLDFPGGWPGDKVNKFVKAGRTPREDSIFNYTKTLANYRKNASAIKTGKLMQFVPEDGVYTYFRYDNNQTVMVVMNTAKEEKTVDTKRFEERFSGFSKGKEITTGAIQELRTKWKLPAKGIWILELMK